MWHLHYPLVQDINLLFKIYSCFILTGYFVSEIHYFGKIVTKSLNFRMSTYFNDIFIAHFVDINMLRNASELSYCLDIILMSL